MVCALPVSGDDTVVFGAGFIVKDLVFNDVAIFLESGHGTVVGCNAVAIVA